MRYKGTEKLGRGLPLQGYKRCVEGARRWTGWQHILVLPGMIVQTEFDLGSWVRDGYLMELPDVQVAPAPVAVAAPTVPSVHEEPAVVAPMAPESEVAQPSAKAEPETKPEEKPEPEPKAEPEQESKLEPNTEPEFVPEVAPASVHEVDTGKPSKAEKPERRARAKRG
jgi:hypothetical protein